MEQRLAWLESLMEDEEAPLSDKVDGLLTVLGEVRIEWQGVAETHLTVIKRQQKIMDTLSPPYTEAEERIKANIWHILEEFSPDEKHDSDIGRVQIVRPKNRISYDMKGLETLRLSSDEVDRMISHLRTEKPSKPYLKVKLK